jgi:hypothetical protein
MLHQLGEVAYDVYCRCLFLKAATCVIVALGMCCGSLAHQRKCAQYHAVTYGRA